MLSICTYFLSEKSILHKEIKIYLLQKGWNEDIRFVNAYMEL